MTSTLARSTPQTGQRPGLALGLLAIAQLMLVLDVTVVNVALPSIGTALHLSRTAVPWVMTAYTVAFGGLMLLGGRVADVVGTRRMVITALAAFTAASAIAGLAHSGTALVASRAGQGVAAAFLSPAALALVSTTFSGEHRNRALSLWAALSGVGAALGLIVGGLLTSSVGWRWIFFINVPIGLAVLAALPAFVPNVAHPRTTRGLDVAGALLVTLGTGLGMYGLINAGGHGWSAAATDVPLVIGALLWSVFILVERTATSPLLAVQLFGRRAVSGSAFLITVATGLLIGGSFLTSFLLQRGHGFSALRVGMSFLPLAIATIIGAQAAGHLLGRFTSRAVGATSLVPTAAGFAVAAHWTTTVDVLIGLSVAMLGIGSAFVVGFSTALADVDEHEAGLRSAITNTFHELGGALGVAVLSSVAGAGLTSPVHHVQNHGIGLAYTAGAIAALAAAAVAWIALPATRAAPSGGHGHGH